MFALLHDLSQGFSLIKVYCISGATSCNTSLFQYWLFRCKCLRFKTKTTKNPNRITESQKHRITEW